MRPGPPPDGVVDLIRETARINENGEVVYAIKRDETYRDVRVLQTALEWRVPVEDFAAHLEREYDADSEIRKVLSAFLPRIEALARKLEEKIEEVNTELAARRLAMELLDEEEDPAAVRLRGWQQVVE